ncbi:MAG: hypothetical protein IRZ28_14905 [Steroidobacteraceae bacterium]|nr:hypothetical protein [Steroidobacteraceae bacterium]
MMELVQLFFQIALSRKGPQDVPASSLLLGLTVIGYFLVNFILSLVLPPIESWQLQLVVEVAFMLGWYAVLLRAFGKPERFLQTATAMFGYQIVLAPLWILAIFLSNRFNDDVRLQFPAVVLGLAIAVWIIRAGSYVLKAALELPMLACVMLFILQLVTGQLLLFAINPGPAPTPAG